MQIKPHYFKLDLLFNFVRCSELVMVYIHLLNGLVYNNQSSFVLGIVIILSSYLNYVLKHDISKPIFSLFQDYIPLLGRGSRPDGAVDCGYFTNCPNQKAKSFGFPSGHSQFAGINAGFLIREIISKKSKNKSFSGLGRSDKISVLLIFMTIPIMMYSRIYIEGCHTVEQTIFGSIIGYFIGYTSYGYYHQYKEKISNYINLNSAYTKLILLLVFILLFNY